MESYNKDIDSTRRLKTRVLIVHGELKQGYR